MPIPIPVTKTIISSPVWGIPITNEVNRLTDQYRFCTSTTRPTGVPNGTMIFETDTGRLFVWRAAVSKWRGLRSSRYVNDGGGGTTSGNAQTVMNAISNIPDPGCDGWLTIWAHFYWNQSVASDAIWFRIKDGASELAQYRAPYGAGVAVTSMTADLVATVQVLQGSVKTIQLVASRESGSGTATVYPDPTLNKMHAIFTPDA
jgi:hypothetical protein